MTGDGSKVGCCIGSDGIPVELFKILKDGAAKVLCSTCQQIWKTAGTTGLEKVSLLPILKKVNAKECSNYHTIALISHASKIMLKILQARLQRYMNQELPDVQAAFRNTILNEVRMNLVSEFLLLHPPTHMYI